MNHLFPPPFTAALSGMFGERFTTKHAVLYALDPENLFNPGNIVWWDA